MAGKNSPVGAALQKHSMTKVNQKLELGFSPPTPINSPAPDQQQVLGSQTL